MPVGISDGGAEGIVLDPVAIERLDGRVRDRLAAFAGDEVAADRPDAETREDAAPVALVDAVLPRRCRRVLALIPLRLERGDRELQRLRMLARLRPRNGGAVDVDLEGPAVVFLRQIDAEGTVGVCLRLPEQQRGLVLDLAVAQERECLFRVGGRQRLDVAIGLGCVQPDGDARERLLAAIAQMTTEPPLEDVSHRYNLPFESFESGKVRGVPSRRRHGAVTGLGPRTSCVTLLSCRAGLGSAE